MTLSPAGCAGDKIFCGVVDESHRTKSDSRAGHLPARQCTCGPPGQRSGLVSDNPRPEGIEWPQTPGGPASPFTLPRRSTMATPCCSCFASRKSTAHNSASNNPSLFRAPVAQSSHSGLKPFCCHFLNAATARSMAGGGMTGGAWHGVGVSTGSFRAPVAQSRNPGLKSFCCHFLDAATTRSMTGGAQHDRWCAQHDR